jgi:hypothetical protein
MDALKGEPLSILFVDNADGRIQLVAYPDESWGIIRRGKTVCTWESDELTDCLRTFLDMAGRPARRGVEGASGAASDLCARLTRLRACEPGAYN